jgi:hypothetical protein
MVAVRMTLFFALSVTPLLAASKLETREVNSVNFAQSKIATSPVRKMVVYLPAGYDDSSKRYPVVYFFPNSFGSYRDAFDHKGAQGILDRAIEAGIIGKFILVSVDMNTSLGSSWCVNSPATGNWEDFVMNGASGGVRLGLCPTSGGDGLGTESPGVHTKSGSYG